MADVNVEGKFRDLINNVGKGAANALFPDEINYYFMAMELLDSNGRTVDYFAWPILPDEIQENHVEITNIRKTIGGMLVLKNPTFAPRQIAIRGDFGRRFKVLINGNKFDFAGIIGTATNIINSIKAGGKSLEIVKPQFSSFAKNGYGCVKFIERMKEKSKQLDSYQKPHTLLLYNPILGNNYVVEFNNFQHKQDSGRYNMISNYTIQLTAVAPINGLFTQAQNIKSTIKNIAFGSLQKSANSLASNVKSILKLKRKF